ncbi:MAG: hypothetical protein ACLFVO_27555 [Chloroflexaceae bacterium]
MEQHIGSFKEIIAAIFAVLLLLILLGVAGLLLVQQNTAQVSTASDQVAAEVAAADTATPPPVAPVTPSAAATATVLPTASATPTPTTTPTTPPTPVSPTEPAVPPIDDPPVAEVLNMGILRDAPDLTTSAVRGQVCPGDQVAVVGEERAGQGRWYEIEVTATGENCDPERVPVATSGWLDSSLVSPPSYAVSDYLAGEMIAVIYRNIAAANAEDMDAYMATIHPESPFYNSTERTIYWMFQNYDLDYHLSAVDLESQSDQEVRIAFKLFTRKLRGPEFRNNEITGVFILQPYNGTWKIYDQNVLDIEYKEELRPL